MKGQKVENKISNTVFIFRQPDHAEIAKKSKKIIRSINLTKSQDTIAIY